MLDAKQIAQLLSQAETLWSGYNLTQLQKHLQEFEEQTLTVDFWQQPQASQTMRQIGDLQIQLDQAKKLQDSIEEIKTIEFLLAQEGEKATYQNQLQSTAQKLAQQIKKLQLQKYLNGKYDSLGAIFSIHAGQGGTEAMDWAQILSRSYQRYFERSGWKHQLISQSRGDEAGIKSISFEVDAKYAYGMLKGEAGTHRLVRLSPFNADNLRQTSFALVETLPLFRSDDHSIEISNDDLAWHFSRSGGAGGQNVNKVNTAVELTYLPLNLTVKCRQERSQEQNKVRALQILKGKLALMKAEQKAKEIKDLKAGQTMASWGTQIRNYVLHPYQLVKDTRSGIETSNTSAVLDGDLDLFIQGNLLALKDSPSKE